MRRFCEWLCPKTNKNQQAYDVNEQTFQMDEHIGDLDPTPKAYPDKEQIPTSNALLNQPTDNRDKVDRQQQLEEIQFTNQKNKLQGLPDQPPNEQQDDEKKFVSSKYQINEQEPSSPQKTEEKPKPKYNILPTKITKKKKAVDPQQLSFVGQSHEFKVKKIGDIQMEQFSIDNCRNGSYFLFDVSASVYIDDTEDCFIFIAPCNSSVFVRNCRRLTVVAAAGQFRTVNCEDCNFSLLCKSGPVIESSTSINFCCFNCPQYEQLASQFETAQLQIWNNYWSRIHDFTPKSEQQHYRLLQDIEGEIDWKRAFEQAGMEMMDQNQTVVPFTRGEPSQDNSAVALLVFDKDTSKQDKLIASWIASNKLELIKTSKMVVEGQGGEPIISILLAIDPEQQLQLEAVNNPTLITQWDQIKQKQAQYFQVFGDERQESS